MKKRSKISAALSALALAAATTLLIANPAAADPDIQSPIQITPSVSSSIWTWSANDPLCDTSEMSVERWDQEGNRESIPGGADMVAFNADRSGGTIDVSSLASGGYTVSMLCETDNSDIPTLYFGGFLFAKVEIEKIVTGTAPEGTEFEVELTCKTAENLTETSYEPGMDTTYTVNFPSTGGTETRYLLTDFLERENFEISCEAVETADGGATEVLYENASFPVLDLSVRDERVFSTAKDNTVKITNVFSTDASGESKDPVDPDKKGGDESDPASPVSKKPTATG